MTDTGGRAHVSPEATGGAGTIDEYRFAAVMLVKVLRGDQAVGLSVPLAAVGLQRREAGNILDDVVLQAELSSTGPRVEYQVKRRMSPSANDRQFLEALDQCLESFAVHGEDIAAGRLALGLAAGGPAGPLSQLHRLAGFARAHPTMESFSAVALKPGVADGLTERFDAVAAAVVTSQTRRGKLLETLDYRDLTLRLLRAVRVWQFSVGSDGHDTINALDRLADILPVDGPTAGDVFAHLVDATETWGPRAGLITAGMVRAELERRGIALTVEPKQRVASAKLSAVTHRQLAETPWTIAGQLELPRVRAGEQIRRAMAERRFVMVTGAPGVGKSVLARRVIRDLPIASTGVIINLAGRGQASLAELQAEFGVDLATALAAAATTGPRVLLIDGAEHAVIDGARLLKAVLATIPLDAASAPPWTVLVTSRTEAASVVRRYLPEAPADVVVLDGDDDELEEVVRSYPQLVPLTRHPRSKRLLRRPYLVDILIRTRADLNTQGVLGEEDVMELVWNELIRRGEGTRFGQGTPHDRALVCRALAEDVLREATGTVLASLPGDAVDGLLKDDILVRQRTQHRFAHDILLDYATAMRLLEGDGSDLLIAAPDKRRLLRPVRLALQRLLSDAVAISAAELIKQWTASVQLSRALADLDGPRWNDIPYEALLAMSEPGLALAALRDLLLQEDAANLRRLIEITRRVATLSERDPSVDGLTIDVMHAAPVVNALATVADAVSFASTVVAADLVRRWLLAATRQDIALADHLTDPRALSRAVALWSGDDEYGDRLKLVLAALGMLAGHHGPEAAAVFERVRHRNHELSLIVEEPEVARVAARDPDLLLGLAGRFYLDQDLALDGRQTHEQDESGLRRNRRTRRRMRLFDEDEDGVRDHTPRFLKVGNVGRAAPHYGPFATLLNTSPGHGLRLIGAVLDVASVARAAIEKSPDRRSSVETLTIRRPGNAKTLTYQGTPTAWGWYQRTGMGDDPALSAAMALAEWAVGQLEHRPLDDVLDQALSVSHTFAIPAVAFALCVARLDLVTDQLDTFLEHPLVWDMEQARVAHAQGGLAFAIKGFNLTRSLDQVVMTLVLRSDTERRVALRTLGRTLLQNSRSSVAAVLGTPPSEDHETMLVARRRAMGFDVEAYLPSTVGAPEGMTFIEVNYPPDLQQSLARAGGAQARLNLRLSGLTTKAVRIRDLDLREDPTPLWTEMTDTIAELETLDGDWPLIYSVQDTKGAVAAAIVTALVRGEISIPDELLIDSLLALLESAEQEDGDDSKPFLHDRDTEWTMGADRSAATALPHVLSASHIAARCESLHGEIETAISILAHRPSSEVRRRLVQAMHDDLTHPCQHDPHRHTAHHRAITTIRALIATSGLTPRSVESRKHVELDEPLRDALGPGDDVLHIGDAADVLGGLTQAAHLSCDHGREVADMLDALIDHDILAWPRRFARRYYEGTEEWRAQLDKYVAELILAGDLTRLNQYLHEFARVPEDLRGLLKHLADQAITTERAELLLTGCWPIVLDKLLPASRNSGDEHSYYQRDGRDIEELDRALLPMPPEDAPWAWELLLPALARWLEAFTATPHVADHAIHCLARYGLLRTPHGAPIVIRLLGTDTAAISEQTRMVVAWLRLALIDDKLPNQPHRTALLGLVDRLADEGNIGAIELQRELELQ